MLVSLKMKISALNKLSPWLLCAHTVKLLSMLEVTSRRAANEFFLSMLQAMSSITNTYATEAPHAPGS